MATTLLLADDSSTIHRVVELTFATEDVDVVAVFDGEAAIARLEASPPDIVLADVDMPGTSGYDIARYVKSHASLAHIPVLLLTGAFEPVDQARAAAAGSDGVLAKPFEPPLMIARVKELLETRGAPAAPPPRPARRPDLDEYFDQLDAAFANFSTGSARAPAAPLETPEVPLSYASPEASFDHGSGTSPSPAAMASPPLLPSITDAFAAILEAEAGGDLPAARWPAPSPAALDDDAIAAIAARVAAQLSDQFARGAVTEIVTATAERLVREEIERIKASIL